MSKSVCNHPHGTCAVCWEKMRELSAALTAAQERERVMREAVEFARSRFVCIIRASLPDGTASNEAKAGLAALTPGE